MKYATCRTGGVAACVLLFAAFGCRSENTALRDEAEAVPPNKEEHRMADDQKKLSHEETLAWIGQRKAWRRARKTRPIWVRELDAQEIGREFMTADHIAEKGREGYVLCVGVAGEPWFQKLDRVVAKYDLQAAEDRRFSFDDRPRSYHVYQPKESTRNWAAQVTDPATAGFFIRPNYDVDHPLYSPRGGYVVKDDVEDPYAGSPDDVWLVQQGLFESTYEFVD